MRWQIINDQNSKLMLDTIEVGNIYYQPGLSELSWVSILKIPHNFNANITYYNSKSSAQTALSLAAERAMAELIKEW